MASRPPPTCALPPVSVLTHTRRNRTPGSADTAETRLGIGGYTNDRRRYPRDIQLAHCVYACGNPRLPRRRRARGTPRSAARQSLQRQPRRQHRHRRSAKRRCAETPQDSHSHRTFQTSQRPPRRHRAQAGRHISMHARVHVHRRRSGRARQRNARGQSSARRGPRTHAESALPGASTVAWRGQGARPLFNADVWGNERAR